MQRRKLDRRALPRGLGGHEHLGAHSLSPALPAYPREVGQRCWRFNEVEKEARESTEKEEQIGDGQMISRQGELGGPDSGQETVTTQPRGRVEGAWELRKQEPGGLEEAISPAGYPQCRAGVWGLWSTCS